MRRNLYVLFAIFCLISGKVAAFTVNSPSGGGLAAVVAAQQPDPLLVTDLAVTGNIDATDFRYIRDNLRNLASLDLSGVNIVAYTGTGGTDCGTTGSDVSATYAANEIPKMALYKRYSNGAFINPIYYETIMENLTTLILPSSITSVGSSAFGKSPFTSIVFPEGVQTIGEKALTFCTNLQNVSFPSSLQSILGTSSSFFEGCTALLSVTFAEPANITSLPHWLFGSSSTELQLPLLTSVTVPSSVTDIGDAFDYFQGTSILCDAGNSVFYSDGTALYRASDNVPVAVPRGITSFTIPPSLTSIPDNMFDGCTKLTTVTVSSALISIGKRAFYNCPITSFIFPPSLVSIGEYAFYGTRLDSVIFTNNPNLTTLDSRVFANVSTLQKADLSGLDTLGTYMFQSCSNLRNVIFGNSLRAITANVFSGCSNLETLTLPNSVQSIASQAFMSCYKLTSINLPENLVSLGEQAFQGDTLIEQFHIPSAFNNLIINSNSGNGFTSTFAAITVDASNPYFSAENGILYNKTKNKLVHVPQSRIPSVLVIPEGVDTLGNSAVKTTTSYCNYPKIILPSTLKYIENYGLQAASKADTLVVRSVIPPALANTSYSLNNRWTAIHPVVLVPPRTKAKYKSATGWANYSDPTNSFGYGAYDFLVPQNLFYDLGGGMAIAVSPDGNYTAGTGTSSAYLFSNGTITNIPNSISAADVNDKGFVAGTFIDYNYQYNGNPISNAGVYRDGQWFTLGLGRYGNTPLSSEAHSDVEAIDSVGNAYGSSYLAGSVAKVVPFVWKYNSANNDYLTDTLAFETPVSYTAGDQGGKIYGISSDGNVASGWISRMIYGGARSAIAWTSPTEYKLFDENNWSESKAVSPNGRYVTATVAGRAAIYDTTLDSLIVFGPEKSSPTAVSDNGFVVGFTQRSVAFESGREGFVWSERLGYTCMRDFLDTYATGVEIPSGDFFNFPKNEAIFDTPMSISADGLVIAGWSGYSALATHGWLLCLADTLNLIDRPKNLTASVNIPQRNVVNLAWEAPQDYGSHTLDFYYIYRDDVKIGSVEPFEGLTFIDTDAPDGNVNYSVSAVYDYTNATSYLESPHTEKATVKIVDNYNIPFSEGFESGTFEYNFWTAESSPTSAWLLSQYTGFTGLEGATFLGSGTQTPYNLSLTSKPFDANGKDKVIVSFMQTVLSNQELFLGVRDTVFVEIEVDNTWNRVAQTVITEKSVWTPITLDVSSVAANKLFRIRFHAVSGANRNEYNYRIDDFGVDIAESPVPSGVIAYRNSGETQVNVIFKDAAGSYGLTYSKGTLNTSVGNEGNSIIAANRFTAKQLKPLAGKYLTSVSAFLFSDYAGTTIPSEFKIAVFVNGTRVENSVITSWKGHEWNNFVLANPVAITGNDDLLVGIEAAHGDSYNRPLSMSGKASASDVKPDADLYSEDGGATWYHAADASIFGHWDIKANFRDESTASQPDDDLFDTLYEIYRNGAKIDSTVFGQFYVDSLGISDNDKYSVRVFRSTGGFSAISEESNITVLSIHSPTNVEFSVYPNPSCDIVNVSTDFASLKLIDMDGRIVRRFEAGKSISLAGLADGIYILEASFNNGQKATARLMKGK